MQRFPSGLRLLIGLIILAGAISCTSNKENPQEVTVTPYLFPDSLTIDPNPINLHDEALFIMAWEDFDNDMRNATLTVRLVNDDEDEIFIEYDDLEITGDTRGVITFTVDVRDGYQGTYFVIAQDESGLVSNEISLYLYVNNVEVEDDDAGDDTTI